MAIRPGEIYFADIGGDERHRLVVVSREELNRGKYIVAVPFTSTKLEERRTLPQCVEFQTGEFGLTKNCIARADNISFVDVGLLDLIEGVVGIVDEERMRDLIQAIGYVIESDCEPI